MMNIGILTFHCAHNYGAVLQCYALRRYLESKGHNTRVVDYRPEIITGSYACHPWSELRAIGLFKAIRRYVLRRRPEIVETVMQRRKRYKVFEAWIGQNLNLSPVSSANYDVLVYGSDQIWNSGMQEEGRVYWGHHEIQAKKHIVYSASAGEIKGVDEWGDEFLRESLGKFSAVAVREPELAQRLSSCTDLPIHCTIDPVFLPDTTLWNELAGKPTEQEKYILMYNLWDEESLYRMAEELHQKTGFKIIDVRGTVRPDDHLHPERLTCASPSDFVRLFRDAQYVLASSFHGVAFSLLFNKPFYTYMPRAGARVQSLLARLGMETRYTDHIPDDWSTPPDYSEANRRIREMSASSKEYLAKYL